MAARSPWGAARLDVFVASAYGLLGKGGETMPHRGDRIHLCKMRRHGSWSDGFI